MNSRPRTLLRGIFIALASGVLFNGLPCIAIAQTPTGHAFEEAESLFHQDPRWLGADGAHSIRLNDKQLFWTFADTFVATSDAHVRHESAMPRNTVAIQTGSDPLTATMKFHWRDEPDGAPTSFFPDDGQAWYWPQASILLDEGPLVTFLYRIVNTPGQGLGFKTTGYAVSVVRNPDSPVETWVPQIFKSNRGRFDFFPATALVRDGDFIVAVAIPQGAELSGALIRYPAASLAQGAIQNPQWWTGDESGWVTESQLGPEGPKIVFDHAGSECSIHWDQRTESWIHITTYGFGAATIGLRTAAELTGTWSEPVTIYQPPENNFPRPFVYGAVAQPELVTSSRGDFVVTYSTNSFDFEDQLSNNQLYWPRVITVWVE